VLARCVHIHRIQRVPLPIKHKHRPWPRSLELHLLLPLALR
jgi:hypothetical protein